MSAVVIISGGLDSCTTLYKAAATERWPIYGISFDYGQRHRKELTYAQTQCLDLGIEHKVVDIRSITELLAAGGSSLFDSNENVPEGHYAEDTMKSTVVPNRNMIMSSIAAGYAVSLGAETLWLGVHGGDHFVYPDCRPRFFNALNAAIILGNEGFGHLPVVPENTRPQEFVRTPYIHKTKEDIAFDALQYGVPLEQTWSCYKGGPYHCGRCGTCVERIEAIQKALARYNDSNRFDDYPAQDPTVYADNDYWKEAVK